MKNGILKLDWKSIGDAVLTAVVLAVITAIYGVVTTQGFNVFAADWSVIGESMVNVAFIGGVISLAQNLLSTNTGSVLGITPSWPATPSA